MTIQKPPVAEEEARHYRGVQQRPWGWYVIEIRDPNRRGSCMWLRTFNMAVDGTKAYGRAAFKLRGSKAILSFPLEAGKYDTIDVIKELKEEKVTKYAGGIVSCSKNMQRLFGTPTATLHFS